MKSNDSLDFEAAVEGAIEDVAKGDPRREAQARAWFAKMAASVPPLEYVMVLAPGATEAVRAVKDPLHKDFSVGSIMVFNKLKVRICAIINDVIHLEEVDEATFNQARSLQAHAKGNTTH